MNTRKFKAPFDITEWHTIKKGDIWEQGKDINEYWCKEFYLPASIVEQCFEEVFDEEPIITLEDIVVGKTVLKHIETGGEYLVTGKNSDVMIGSIQYSIYEINCYFTIKK